MMKATKICCAPDVYVCCLFIRVHLVLRLARFYGCDGIPWFQWRHGFHNFHIQKHLMITVPINVLTYVVEWKTM